MTSSCLPKILEHIQDMISDVVEAIHKLSSTVSIKKSVCHTDYILHLAKGYPPLGTSSRKDLAWASWDGFTPDGEIDEEVES